MCVWLRETDAVNEYRLRVAAEATEVPTDWNVIGARIVEAAERACAIHIQLSGGRLTQQDIENLVEQSTTGG